jgi:peroxiredoxin
MRYLFSCLALLTSLTLAAQTGYKIDFKIKGIKDTTVYLGYYYGESTYRSDTARADKNGAFSFTGKTTLGQGVYMLIFPKGKDLLRGVEFVVGLDQTFLMETSTEDYVKNMKVTGDEDNRLFFENMIHNMERGKEAEPFVKVLNDSTIAEENKKDAREGFQNLTKKVMTYQDEIIKKYPKTVTARILKANKPVEIPDAPTLPNGEKDPAYGYKYYKAHFFDNFDLADDALIRMPRPFYVEKLKEYLDKMVVPQQDSLIKEIDKLASIARKNQETYKYLVWMCMVKYQTPEIMGLDAVYVHLFDKYFGSKEMDFWINAKTKQNLKDHADQLRLSLIGMTAPNLKMQDANMQPRSMYDIKNKYTILFIFDPDCGHCREETPKLVNFYNAHRTKFDVEVYAVSADSSMKKMRDYIKEMKMPWITVNGPRSYVGSYQKLYDAAQTPSVYIIDNRKKIIAKKPPIEKLEDFLSHYEEAQKKKTSGTK